MTAPRPPDRTSAWRVLIALALLGCAVLAIQRIQLTDFSQDYAAAHGWRDGRDPNAPTATLLAACCPDIQLDSRIVQTAHPPAATLLVVPLSLLPWPLARLAWLLLSWVTITLSWQRLRVRPLICLATAPLWLISLSLGTLEPLLLGLLTLAVWQRMPTRAGLLIGLAAAIKIYPLALLPALWLSGRRRQALAALAGLLVLSGLAELILGHAATASWLHYTPINTALQVHEAQNLSLVHLLLSVLPGLTPLLAAALWYVLLTLPLLPRLRQGAVLQPMLPVMLLCSPICWDQYLGVLALAPLRRLELICLGGAGALLALVWMGLLPGSNLAPLGYGPLILVLLLVWYRQLRPSATARPDAIPMAGDPVLSGKEPS